MTIGKGRIESPDTIKRFDDYSLNGGNLPYPSNNMAMDITEFTVPTGKNIFIMVYDAVQQQPVPSTLLPLKNMMTIFQANP